MFLALALSLLVDSYQMQVQHPGSITDIIYYFMWNTKEQASPGHETVSPFSNYYWSPENVSVYKKWIYFPNR